jgi:hypothetical protein
MLKLMPDFGMNAARDFGLSTHTSGLNPAVLLSICQPGKTITGLTAVSLPVFSLMRSLSQPASAFAWMSKFFDGVPPSIDMLFPL